MKSFPFLICIMMLTCTSAFGQVYSMYERYEKYQKQEEKTLRYLRESAESYQRYQSYRNDASRPGNTAAERADKMYKAQYYFQKAKAQNQKFNDSYKKTRQYQREIFSPPIKKVKPNEYSEPKIPWIRNPYHPRSTYNMYQYPQGRPYKPIEPKGGLAGYKSYYDYW